ncbi:MAG: hypothetical protein CMF59_03245 [Leptospiraceae bacterium]|nr:hypothetical protein [Leptospiraceae bacterium]
MGKSNVWISQTRKTVIVTALSLLCLLGTYCSGAAIQPATSYSMEKDLVYDRTSDYSLLADLYRPSGSEEARPGILVLHGGSWQRGSKERMSDVANELAAQGFVVLNANYRLAPDHPYPAQIEDVRKAIQYMRSNAESWSMDPDRIGVLGYSAGGHLALLLALLPGSDEARVQAVVTAGAPTDLTAYGDIVTMHRLLKAEFRTQPEVYRQASPLYHASPSAPPLLLIHGRYDWIVPISHARKLAAAMAKKGGSIDLVELPDGHMGTTLGVNEESLRATVDFFQDRLSSVH